MSGKIKGLGFEVELPDSADKIIENLTDPITKQMGRSGGDLVDLTLGWFSHLADRVRLKRTYGLLQLGRKLEEGYARIPESRRIEEVNTQIIMGALMDSQYCVDEPELCDLFANLILASMNADVSPRVHPIYSDIIRRMTPLDAQNLTLFKDNGNLPIANYVYWHKGRKEEKFEIFQRMVFLSNPNIQDIPAQARSLDALSALGLIEIDMINCSEEPYDKFYGTPLFLQGKSYVETEGRDKYDSIDVYKGAAQKTALGVDFLAVCMP